MAPRRHTDETRRAEYAPFFLKPCLQDKDKGRQDDSRADVKRNAE